MGGHGHGAPLGVEHKFAGFFVDFEHLVGVSVVGGDDGGPSELFDGLKEAAKGEVGGLDSDDGGFEVSGVTDHVAVGVIDAGKSDSGVVLEGLNGGVGDFGSFHPGALVERDAVGGDFDVFFEFFFEGVGAVSVPEIGDVPVFLGFADGELFDVGLREKFAHGARDFGGADEEFCGDAEIAVVLHHADKQDVGSSNSVEFIEIFGFKSARQFDGAVASEIKEEDGVAVLDGANGLFVLCDHKGWDVLVVEVGILGARGGDGGGGARGLRAVTEHMGMPSHTDHFPVGFVAVHGDEHAAAARGDAVVFSVGGEFVEEFFDAFDVGQGALSGDVASVEQDVESYGEQVVAVGLMEEGFDVVDVAVDVAVGEQADEVQRGVVFLDVVHDFLPGGGSVVFGVEEGAGADGDVDSFCALVVDFPGAKGVVSDFGVAHVFVGGHADVGPVGKEGGLGDSGVEVVHGRGAGEEDGVASVVASDADAVEDDDGHGAFEGRGRVGFLEGRHGGTVSRGKMGRTIADWRGNGMWWAEGRGACLAGGSREIEDGVEGHVVAVVGAVIDGAEGRVGVDEEFGGHSAEPFGCGGDVSLGDAFEERGDACGHAFEHASYGAFDAKEVVDVALGVGEYGDGGLACWGVFGQVVDGGFEDGDHLKIGGQVGVQVEQGVEAQVAEWAGREAKKGDEGGVSVKLGGVKR